MRVFAALFMRVVGLSNILDSELDRRKPKKRSHGQVVGAAIVEGKLLCKVEQRIKSVAGIETLLVFAVAALDLAALLHLAAGIGIIREASKRQCACRRRREERL